MSEIDIYKNIGQQMISDKEKTKELEERINKAIEFIDEFWKKNSEYYSVENCLEFCEFDKEDLLSILRGEK